MKANKTILIINWRSLKDPLSGGAEVATMEMAKRWVQTHDARVLWVSPPPKPHAENEIIDGVEFNYLGRSLTRNNFTLFFNYLYFCVLVFIFYFYKYRNLVDIVIDQAHGFPYLTPLYIRKKKILYIHEVAGSIWTKMYPFPLGILGRLLEPLFFVPYRNVLTITVTNSTKKDLEHLGLKKVVVVNNGLTVAFTDKKPNREKEFTIIYLNRLVKMKRIELAIDIFAEFLKKNPKSILWVVGRGDEDYVNYLNKKCFDLGISGNVKFWGFVDEGVKVNLLSKAHVLINSSSKEGWGLVNIEANAQGTPVVAFNVAGNNESVVNNVSGFLVENDNIDKMVEKLSEVKNSYNKWFDSCINHAKKYDWNKLSTDFYNLILSK